MGDLDELFRGLQEQRKVLEELLLLVQRARFHKAESPPPARKNVLALLSESLDTIRQNRNAWLRLAPAEKQTRPEVSEMLRDSQNLIMKILVLEKEKEQAVSRTEPDTKEIVHAPTPQGQASGLLAKRYQRYSGPADTDSGP